VENICRFFPAPAWAIVLLSLFGAIILGLMGWVCYLKRKKGFSEDGLRLENDFQTNEPIETFINT